MMRDLVIVSLRLPLHTPAHTLGPGPSGRADPGPSPHSRVAQPASSAPLSQSFSPSQRHEAGTHLWLLGPQLSFSAGHTTLAVNTHKEMISQGDTGPAANHTAWHEEGASWALVCSCGEPPHPALQAPGTCIWPTTVLPHHTKLKPDTFMFQYPGTNLAWASLPISQPCAQGREMPGGSLLNFRI